MFPDVDGLRRLASTYRARAEEVRASASDVIEQVAATPWHGSAADAARNAAETAALTLTARADDHDAIAADLIRHADAVAQTLATIAAIREEFLSIARSVGAAVTEAAEFAGDALSVAGEVADGAGDALGGVAGGAVSAVGDGLSAVGDALGGDDDALREQIERMTVPPPGDLGWLDIDLGGLR